LRRRFWGRPGPSVSGATRSTNELMVLTFVPKTRKATKPSFPQLREISHIDDAKNGW
jgi:hypothetical protein